MVVLRLQFLHYCAPLIPCFRYSDMGVFHLPACPDALTLSCPCDLTHGFSSGCTHQFSTLLMLRVAELKRAVEMMDLDSNGMIG